MVIDRVVSLYIVGTFGLSDFAARRSCPAVPDGIIASQPLAVNCIGCGGQRNPPGGAWRRISRPETEAGSETEAAPDCSGAAKFNQPGRLLDDDLGATVGLLSHAILGRDRVLGLALPGGRDRFGRDATRDQRFADC